MEEQNNEKLWNTRLVTISMANFLVTSAVFMLFPYQMQLLQHFGYSESLSALCVCVFFIGMFVLGPFNAYLVDAFRRKSVAMISLLVMIGACVLMEFMPNEIACFSLRLIQGMCFGTFEMALGATLLNDLTISKYRTAADYYYSWMGLLGLPFGFSYSFAIVTYMGVHYLFLSIALFLVLSFLLLMPLNVPFRAPIKAPILSLDRFFTFKAIVLVANLVMVAMIPTLFAGEMEDHTYLLWMAMGVVAGFLSHRIIFANADNRADAVTGMILVFVAVAMKLKPDGQQNFLQAAFVLLGLGLSWFFSRLLLYFLKSSDHCQRGTLQQTYIISLFLGNCIGYFIGYIFTEVYILAGILAAVSLVFFLTITHPWFCKINGREFKSWEM